MDEIVAKIKENARKEYIPILQDKSLELIESILEKVKPNTILEIGTAVGYSAISFSKYLTGDNSKITTIEINEEMYNIANKNIQSVGKQNQIQTVLADAEDYLKGIDSIYDVVFIDAAKGQYIKYLDQAMRLTKKGSVIIADNVLFKGRVLGEYNEHKHRTAVNRLREYIKRVTEDEGLDSTIYDVGDGVAVSIRKN